MVKKEVLVLYNGTSPGYFTRDKDSGYVPQAYPQIANALETLANNIPTETNLPVEKGYALTTDLHPLIVYALAGALGGFLYYVGYWPYLQVVILVSGVGGRQQHIRLAEHYQG
jgi:hypothetical protein